MSNPNELITDFLEENDEKTDTSDIDLYDDLTPIYDAFYSKHYDYENQAEIIDEYCDLSAGDVVLEGACGTGRLLELLEASYEAHGFDISPQMLDIASERVEAPLFRADLLDFYIPKSVDGLFIFGNAFYHISPDERKTVFKQAYENMSNQSTFIFTFMDANEFEDGYSGGDIYELEDWKIRRNSISALRTDSQVTTAFSYRISQVEDDYKRFQVGVSVDGYVHQTNEIESELHNLGFTNITITKPDELKHTVAIARKVS